MVTGEKDYWELETSNLLNCSKGSELKEIFWATV